MKKYLLLLGCMLSLAIIFPKTTLAHVLITDARANVGAVLHITPDDDPVAGQTSQLYFDLQDQNSQARLPAAGYELLATDEQNKTVTIPLAAANTSLIAVYAFPTQGLYKLTLRSRPSYEQFIKIALPYSLRVSRGTTSSLNTTPSHPTAAIVSLVAVIALVMLAILAFNYRHSIARQSSF